MFLQVTGQDLGDGKISFPFFWPITFLVNSFGLFFWRNSVLVIIFFFGQTFVGYFFCPFFWPKFVLPQFVLANFFPEIHMTHFRGICSGRSAEG